MTVYLCQLAPLTGFADSNDSLNVGVALVDPYWKAHGRCSDFSSSSNKTAKPGRSGPDNSLNETFIQIAIAVNMLNDSNTSECLASNEGSFSNNPDKGTQSMQTRSCCDCKNRNRIHGNNACARNHSPPSESSTTPAPAPGKPTPSSSPCLHGQSMRGWLRLVSLLRCQSKSNGPSCRVAGECSVGLTAVSMTGKVCKIPGICPWLAKMPPAFVIVASAAQSGTPKQASRG